MGRKIKGLISQLLITALTITGLVFDQFFAKNLAMFFTWVIFFLYTSLTLSADNILKSLKGHQAQEPLPDLEKVLFCLINGSLFVAYGCFVTGVLWVFICLEEQYITKTINPPS